MVTDIAWYLVVLNGSCVWKKRSATIWATLSRIGAAAAIQNLWSELRMPPNSEASEISIK